MCEVLHQCMLRSLCQLPYIIIKCCQQHCILHPPSLIKQVSQSVMFLQTKSTSPHEVLSSAQD